MIVDLFENFTEVGRTIEAALLQCILIALNNTLHSCNTRIENISVHSEAVRRTVSVRRNGTTKTVKVDHLVRVIELKNVAHILDSLQILVALRIEIVE